MDAYEKRITQGWQALTLRTEDVIVRVEDTGQLVNMSALKRRHDRECSYSRGGRLFLVGRALCCQYGGCIVKRLREPEKKNQSASRAGKTRKTSRKSQTPPDNAGTGGRAEPRRPRAHRARGNPERPRKNTPAGPCRIKTEAAETYRTKQMRSDRRCGSKFRIRAVAGLYAVRVGDPGPMLPGRGVPLLPGCKHYANSTSSAKKQTPMRDCAEPRRKAFPPTAEIDESRTGSAIRQKAPPPGTRTKLTQEAASPGCSEEAHGRWTPARTPHRPGTTRWRTDRYDDTGGEAQKRIPRGRTD